MKPEHNRLLDDTIMPAGHREATLSAGSRVLRRRRHKQIAGQFLAIALVAVAAVLFLEKRPAGTTTAQIAAATAHSQPGARSLNTVTDEELLALFPKTPVGIAKLSNGHKVLIFPHPGDEKRFITHL